MLAVATGASATSPIRPISSGHGKAPLLLPAALTVDFTPHILCAWQQEENPLGETGTVDQAGMHWSGAYEPRKMI